MVVSDRKLHLDDSICVGEEWSKQFINTFQDKWDKKEKEMKNGTFYSKLVFNQV